MRGNNGANARFGINPGGLVVGLATAVLLFLALVVANWSLIRSDLLPVGDLAADMVLMQRARDGWLLTGHYSLTKANHPGPYFLYVRYLGEVLAAPIAGSTFGAQLFGTYANSALFMGLFAALLHGVAGRIGAANRTAMAVACTAVMLAVFQLSSVIGRTAFGNQLRVSLADPWMPDALIAPCLTFLTAALLTAEGRGWALVVTSFCAGALVHGYAPMPLIVGPVWLMAVLLGLRARKRSGLGGFPAGAWLAVGGIVLAFLSPILVDCLIHYPGNVGRILQASGLSDSARRRVGLMGIVWALGRQGTQLHPILWAVALFGCLAGLVVGRFATVWRNAAALIALTGALFFLAYIPSPVGVQEYQMRPFSGVVLFTVSLGVVGLVLWAERHHRKAPAALMALALAVTSAKLLGDGLATPFKDQPDARHVADWMAAGVPVGGVVVVDGGPRLVVVSLLLFLDRFGVTGCSTDAAGSYIYTPERLCRADRSHDRVYRVQPLPECQSATSLPPPDNTNRLILPVGQDGLCIAVTRDDHQSHS